VYKILRSSKEFVELLSGSMPQVMCERTSLKDACTADELKADTGIRLTDTDPRTYIGAGALHI